MLQLLLNDDQVYTTVIGKEKKNDIQPLQHLVMTYHCHNGHHNRYKALGGVTHLSRMLVSYILY